MFIITTVQSVAVQCSEISIYILLDLLLLTVWVEIKKQHSSDALSWVWWQTWIDFKCKECPTNFYSSCKCKYNSVFYILIRPVGWHIDRSRQFWQKINQEMTKQRLLSLPSCATETKHWNIISVGAPDNGVTVVAFSLHFPIWLAIYLVWIILLTGV